MTRSTRVLIISFSLIFGTGSARAQDSAELQSRLQTLVHQLRFPGTPGSPPGPPPKPVDAERIGGELLSWKQTVEKLLARSDRSEDPGATDEDTLDAFSRYMDALTSLVMLRMTLGLSYDAPWREPFSLELTPAFVAEFPELPATVTLDASSGNSVKARLTESLIQGLEIGRLAQLPGPASLVVMQRFLIVQQLMRNLSGLRYLKKDRHVGPAEVPPVLIQKLRAALASPGSAVPGTPPKTLVDNLIATLTEENERTTRAAQDPATRLALIETYEEIHSEIPKFTTAELAQGIARIVSEVEQPNPAAVRSLKDRFSEAEAVTSRQFAGIAIEASTLTLSLLSPRELEASLRAFLVSSRETPILSEIHALKRKGILKLAPEQVRRIIGLIEAAKKEYSANLPAPLLSRWRLAARRIDERKFYEKRRSDFMAELMMLAPEVSRERRALVAGTRVSLPALFDTVLKRFDETGLRSKTMTWLAQLKREPSYAAARKSYTRLVSELLVPRDAGPRIAPELLVNGRVDGARAMRFIETESFTPPGSFDFPLGQKMRDDMEKGARMSLLQLVQAGELLGFHRSALAEEPTVGDVIRDRKQHERYSELLETRGILDSHRILATEVSLDGKSMRLAEALVAVNSPPEVQERSERLIDQALENVEASIRESIRLVAETEDPERLLPVLESSMMLALEMKSSPEFSRESAHWRSAQLAPTITELVTRQIVPAYMVAGMLAWVLMKGIPYIKFLAPIVRLAGAGLRPLIQGYATSVYVVSAADLAFLGNKLYQDSRTRKVTDTFFNSAAEGDAFIDAGAERRIEAENRATWKEFGYMAAGTLVPGAFQLYAKLRGAQSGARIAAQEKAIAGLSAKGRNRP